MIMEAIQIERLLVLKLATMMAAVLSLEEAAIPVLVVVKVHLISIQHWL
jgi:hypothetical protein